MKNTPTLHLQDAAHCQENRGVLGTGYIGVQLFLYFLYFSYFGIYTFMNYISFRILEKSQLFN